MRGTEGGPALGIAVLLLDVTTAVLPVVVAIDVLGLDGWALALVALLGTWIGLTLWTIPLVAFTTIVVATLLAESDGWAVAIALAAMLVGVLLWMPGGWAVLTLVLQAAIILWKHRAHLAHHPRPRRRARRPA